ncbi:MAG: deacetylase [Magnetococcales bacterium]|nr:deacetylase [Magnetococcales bacterium]
MPMHRPAFLITIDTEGDYLWRAPRTITTHNARHLPRFQSLCEQYGLRPTWLTNYEMVMDPCYQEFARDLLARKTGEVGMHLHAWNSPPLSFRLTDDDMRFHPYLIEYPLPVMAAKIRYLTELLESVFGQKMRSHRAGRWAFNAQYAHLLVQNGYAVDCSVTPHISWQGTPGHPGGNGGTDYRLFPEGCYLMDLTAIQRPGASGLLQVPVTIRTTPFHALRQKTGPFEHRLRRHCAVCLRLLQRLPTVRWLRPNGNNRREMLSLLQTIKRRKEPYAEFILHSSELMPGGSPTFRTEREIDRLYADLEALFASAAQDFSGQTLTEFYLTQTTTESPKADASLVDGCQGARHKGG